MNLKKIEFNEIRNYVLFGSGQFVNLLAPLLVAPYVISVCGVEQWGKIGAATSVFTILGIFIDFGSQLIGVKEVSSNKENKKYLTNYLNFTYAFRFIALLLLVTGFLILLFTVPHVDFKLYGLGLFLLISQFFNPIWFYIGFEDFKKINRIIIFSKVIYVASVYIVVKQKADYFYVIFLLGLANMIVYSFYYLKIFKEYKMSLFSISKNILTQNVIKEFPFVVSNLSISVYTNFPILIVKFVLGDFYAGIYKIADMLLSILRSYLVVFFNVSFPKFCGIYFNNKKQSISYLKKVNVLNVLFLTLIISTLFLTSFFLSTIFDLDKKLLNSVSFCRNFLLVSLIIALNIPFYQMLILKNKQKKIAKISFLGSLLMLVSCYFLSKNIGLEGSVISIYIVETFITIAMILSSIYFFKEDSQT